MLEYYLSSAVPWPGLACLGSSALANQTQEPPTIKSNNTIMLLHESCYATGHFLFSVLFFIIFLYSFAIASSVHSAGLLLFLAMIPEPLKFISCSLLPTSTIIKPAFQW